MRCWMGERASTPSESRGETSLSTQGVPSEDLFHSPAGTEIHSPRSENEPEGMPMAKGSEVFSSTPKRGSVPRESHRGDTAGERAPTTLTSGGQENATVPFAQDWAGAQ